MKPGPNFYGAPPHSLTKREFDKKQGNTLDYQHDDVRYEKSTWFFLNEEENFLIAKLEFLAFHQI